MMIVCYHHLFDYHLAILWQLFFFAVLLMLRSLRNHYLMQAHI